MTSLLFIYLCLVLYGIFFSDRQIFQPPIASYQDARPFIKLQTRNGNQIAAVYLPNPTAKYTILYSHGNAEDLGYTLPTLQDLQAQGFAVLGYDYQGYGTSQGQPSEANAYQDIDAAYQYLTTQLKIPPQQIILYGRSVGGGPTLDLASQQPVAAVITESTFITAFRTLTIIPIVPFDKFNNLQKIRRIRCPILILHGTIDEVIPFWHGEALFRAANSPKRFEAIAGASHNDVVEVAGKRYSQILQSFVATLP